MPIQRKYEFKPGTKISSSQVNEELNQLVAAANDLETANNQKDKDLRAIAQLNKITSDNGGTKLSINETSGDVLTELYKLGQGFHTFYAVGGSKNLPPSNISIRGIAHLTSANHGWAHATDYNNTIFTNYLQDGIWSGWKYLSPSQEKLWTGVFYMSAAQTVKPSKKLSECRNGWILVWSDFDPSPNNAPNDYDIAYSFIPKGSDFVNGHQSMFIIPSYQSASSVNYVNKKLRVFNDRLEGFDDNFSSTTGANDVVLRNVIEW